ncbi:UDP-sugar pyrophosphorylase-like, partial [Hordeum vulgare subsp. vulgare]
TKGQRRRRFQTGRRRGQVCPAPSPLTYPDRTASDSRRVQSASLTFRKAVGVKEAHNAAFVLVAGGLGERLGYKGIKVALPMETATGKCFLQHYIKSILSLQEASYKMEGECHTKITFAIMTSDDTNALTIKLLESNSYFGMEPSQVKILKQVAFYFAFFPCVS